MTPFIPPLSSGEIDTLTAVTDQIREAAGGDTLQIFASFDTAALFGDLRDIHVEILADAGAQVNKDHLPHHIGGHSIIYDQPEPAA